MLIVEVEEPNLVLATTLVWRGLRPEDNLLLPPVEALVVLLILLVVEEGDAGHIILLEEKILPLLILVKLLVLHQQQVAQALFLVEKMLSGLLQLVLLEIGETLLAGISLIRGIERGDGLNFLLHFLDIVNLWPLIDKGLDQGLLRAYYSLLIKKGVLFLAQA